MNIIRKTIINFNYKKMLKKDKNVIKKHYPMGELKSIGVIFPFGAIDLKTVNKFIDALNFNFSSKKIIGYSQENRAKTNKHGDNVKNVFYNSNFSLGFKPNSDLVIDFLNTKFDLLINISKNNVILKSLILSINSSFRVGWYNNSDSIYDFMILNKNQFSYEFFMEEVLKYLNKMQFIKK